MSKIKIYPNYLVIIDDNFVEPISITNRSSLARQTKRSEEYYLTKIVYEYIGKWIYAIEMPLGPKPEMGRIGPETQIFLEEIEIQAV